MRTIIVPLDGSNLSDALRPAFSIAQRTNATVVAMRVHKQPLQSRRLRDDAKQGQSSRVFSRYVCHAAKSRRVVRVAQRAEQNIRESFHG